MKAQPLTYNKITHYIDRQFGCVLWIVVEDGKIIDVADAEYKGKLKDDLLGKTIEEAQAFLKKNFKIYMQIKSK